MIIITDILHWMEYCFDKCCGGSLTDLQQSVSDIPQQIRYTNPKIKIQN